MGLIRVIFILILIYLAIRIVFQYILFPFFKGYFSPVNPRNEEQKKRNYRNNEGVTMTYNPSGKKKMVDKNTGDYVDYEEIRQ